MSVCEGAITCHPCRVDIPTGAAIVVSVARRVPLRQRTNGVVIRNVRVTENGPDAHHASFERSASCWRTGSSLAWPRRQPRFVAARIVSSRSSHSRSDR